MNILLNKIAVVTGGNSGLGYAAAKELKARGARVVITGRRKEALAQAAAELGVTAVEADQASLAATVALVQTVKEQFGGVDFLYINAGVLKFSTIADVTEAHFEELVNINLKGAFFTLSKFIPVLNEGASVILLTSYTTRKPAPGVAVYSATKAALKALMQVAALELAPRKIRVNAICPGWIDTAIMVKGGLDEAAIAGYKAAFIAQTPLARLGEPADLAGLVVYLASDAASYITGSEFTLDGGALLT